jgi:hypothetical protein
VTFTDHEHSLFTSRWRVPASPYCTVDALLLSARSLASTLSRLLPEYSYTWKFPVLPKFEQSKLYDSFHESVTVNCGVLSIPLPLNVATTFPAREGAEVCGGAGAEGGEDGRTVTPRIAQSPDTWFASTGAAVDPVLTSATHAAKFPERWLSDTAANIRWRAVLSAIDPVPFASQAARAWQAPSPDAAASGVALDVALTAAAEDAGAAREDDAVVLHAARDAAARSVTAAAAGLARLVMVY